MSTKYYDNYVDGVKLPFIGKKVLHNKKKGCTTVIVEASLEPFLDFVSFSPYDKNGKYTVTKQFIGMAQCSKDDKYDEEKGYKIASARAENEAYLFARDIINKEVIARNRDTKRLMKIADSFTTYRQHNKKFIKSVPAF